MWKEIEESSGCDYFGTVQDTVWPKITNFDPFYLTIISLFHPQSPWNFMNSNFVSQCQRSLQTMLKKFFQLEKEAFVPIT